jgi:uncharacterized protein YdhG (YjbR/CyaY superfamily)
MLDLWVYGCRDAEITKHGLIRQNNAWDRPGSAGFQPALWYAKCCQHLHAALGWTWILTNSSSSIGRMKKLKSGKRGAPKAKGATKSVEQYLAGIPGPARGTLNKLRAAIRSAVPAQAFETISYGIPAFKHKGVVVWFAAFSNHCSLFPTAAVIEAFKSELKGFTLLKGTIQFPTGKPLPSALVKKLVKARLAQMEDKKKR